MRNVLLLSMSTLPKLLKKNKYWYKDENKEYYFTGYSQMEPGTKLVLNKLADEGEQLSCIIVIHSKECQEPLEKTVKEICNEKALKSDVENLDRLSANEFYKRRVLQYCKEPEQYHSESDTSNVPETESWNKCFLHDLQDKTEGDWIQFVSMSDGKEGDIYSCLPTVLDKIIGDEDPENVCLWVDTQGGRRNETFVMNCVIHMLRIRKVKVCNYYAVDFNQTRRSDEPQPLLDVTRNNIILDLVSGMEMFVSVARADKLREYYNRYKKIKNVKYMSEQMVIDKISEVADAISICNMGIFGDKLKELKDAIDKYENTSSDPIFRYLIQDMKREYGKLLYENHKISDEIIWCEDHKLFQQALTLVEAQLPKQIFDELLKYDRIAAKQKYAEVKSDANYDGRFIENEYQYQNMDHYVFGEWWYNNKSKTEQEISNQAKIKWKTKKKKGAPCEEEEIVKFEIEPRRGTTPRRQIKLIQAYNKVKDLRNGMNHGNSKKAIEEVKACIDEMLKAMNVVRES